MSTFQWNKYYSKIICGSKVITKTVKKNHFSESFSKLFEHFWVVITFKLLWTPLLPWLMYVKLIIGARDQRLLMGTKWGTYNCHSFNCAYTTSIVKSLKRQTFYKLINFESTHTTHKHAIKWKMGCA